MGVVTIVMTSMKSPYGVDAVNGQRKGGKAMVLFRQELGDVLRDARRSQGRTLRQVSSDARVALGYLSEIERGQKEASSELLLSVTGRSEERRVGKEASSWEVTAA